MPSYNRKNKDSDSKINYSDTYASWIESPANRF